MGARFLARFVTGGMPACFFAQQAAHTGCVVADFLSSGDKQIPLDQHGRHRGSYSPPTSVNPKLQDPMLLLLLAPSDCGVQCAKFDPLRFRPQISVADFKFLRAGTGIERRR
jgi:hypothetical protein